MSEEHFTVLLNLIGEEKKSRLHLEKRVNQLQSELISTQQGVTQVYHSGQKHNSTIRQQSASLTNLERNYNELQRKYDSLLKKYDDRDRTNQSSYGEFANLIESLKGLPDLKKSVIELTNKTQYISGNLEHATITFGTQFNDLESRQNIMRNQLELLKAAENKTDVMLQKHVNTVSKKGKPFTIVFI